VLTDFLLSQNYPNPFNNSSVISYSIPKSSQVTLKIFNTLGEEKPTGSYYVEFDGTGLTSGIYFYKLQAGDFISTKKMILMK
jgi:hypothetical protein